jgi:hypothetical protein
MRDWVFPSVVLAACFLAPSAFGQDNPLRNLGGVFRQLERGLEMPTERRGGTNPPSLSSAAANPTRMPDAPNQECREPVLSFSDACLGDFTGTFVVSPDAMSPPGPLQEVESGLSTLGMRLSVVPVSSSSLIHQVRSPEAHCVLHPESMELSNVTVEPPAPVFSAILQKCFLSSGDLHIRQMRIVWHASGPKIDQMEGIFAGNPGNRVRSGPFHAALETKYGKQNDCLDDEKAWCFVNPIGHRIEVREAESDGQFLVKLSDAKNTHRNESIIILRQRAKERENAAPVKRF